MMAVTTVPTMSIITTILLSLSWMPSATGWTLPIFTNAHWNGSSITGDTPVQNNHERHCFCHVATQQAGQGSSTLLCGSAVHVNESSQSSVNRDDNNNDNNNEKSDDDDNANSDTPTVITSVLLTISYDGERFSGWTASNDSTKRRPTRPGQKGYVRSVEGIIRMNLGRLFSNADPSRIVVEGCSRTDKGVHATHMVAQAYCLTEDWQTKWNADKIQQHDDDDDGSTTRQQQQQDASTSIQSVVPGKTLPHPASCHDTSFFVPFPMPPSRLSFVLNRMFPDDLAIKSVVPSPNTQTDGRPFHATLDAVSKTYRYIFSVGPIHDPTFRKTTWHIGDYDLDEPAMERIVETLQGQHDFAAFRGTSRGKDDKAKQRREDSVCSLYNVTIERVSSPSMLPLPTSPFPGLSTYVIHVRGDRFLYKMIRFLVGTIVEAGKGNIDVDTVRYALEDGAFLEGHKPFCAPAHGLTLIDVAF